MRKDKKCPLCNLEKKTKWYYEDSYIVICDCETCRMPMLVFRRHGMLGLSILKYGERKVEEVFGKRLLYFRTRGRKIRDHEHWHIYLKKG